MLGIGIGGQALPARQPGVAVPQFTQGNHHPVATLQHRLQLHGPLRAPAPLADQGEVTVSPASQGLFGLGSPGAGDLHRG